MEKRKRQREREREREREEKALETEGKIGGSPVVSPFEDKAA